MLSHKLYILSTYYVDSMVLFYTSRIYKGIIQQIYKSNIVLPYHNGILYTVFTERSICSLGKNQYTFNVELGSTKTETKHWSNSSFRLR